MGRPKAHHRCQLRLYDEDLEHIEKLRLPGESTTDVIRRSLRVALQAQSSPFLLREELEPLVTELLERFLP